MLQLLSHQKEQDRYRLSGSYIGLALRQSEHIHQNCSQSYKNELLSESTWATFDNSNSQADQIESVPKLW